MRRMQNVYLALTAWLFLSVAFVMSPAMAAPSVQPLYECTGKNHTGETYRAFLETRNDGDIYVFHWFGAGETIGFGFEDNGRLVLSMLTPEGNISVASFKVGKTELTGRWLLLGATEIAEMSCKVIDKLPEPKIEVPEDAPTPGARV